MKNCAPVSPTLVLCLRGLLGPPSRAVGLAPGALPLMSDPAGNPTHFLNCVHDAAPDLVTPCCDPLANPRRAFLCSF